MLHKQTGEKIHCCRMRPRTGGAALRVEKGLMVCQTEEKRNSNVSQHIKTSDESNEVEQRKDDHSPLADRLMGSPHKPEPDNCAVQRGSGVEQCEHVHRNR